MVDWALQRPATFTDIYFCLSLQGRIGRKANGKPSVARSQADAMLLRSIWLDIDIKEPPKGYADLHEALKALDVFIKAYNLPFPTAIVGSGGGLHVYWVSDRDFSPDEWRPYAEGLRAAAVQHGLRCDGGVSIDSARILRVPGTFNYKLADQPRAVKILALEPNDISFDTALKHLAVMAPVSASIVTAAVTPAFDLTAFQGKKPSAAWAALNPQESLADGIEHNSDPLDPKPILAKGGCPFFRDAFNTHGKDHDQPLWMLTVLAATFWQNGDAFAHELSNGHPTYRAEDTDAMIARKTRERGQRGLGWPSCTTFENNGCTQCKLCPHKGKVRSPLNLALVPKQQPANFVTTQQLVQASVGLCLPKDYAVDPKTGVICEIMTIDNKGQAPIQELIPLFHSKLTEPWAQKGPDALNFTTTTDKGNFRSVSIPYEAMMVSTDLMRTLGKQMVKPDIRFESRLKRFFVAWINELHEKQAAVQSMPFGWLEEGGTLTGFVYGGVIMKADGSEHPAGYSEKQLRETFAPKGELQPWYNAMKLITDQKRPELEVLVAASFAAPLIRFGGENGGTFSATGTSGGNKSSAAMVGMAVWGHPKLSKETPTSSEKSVEAKMGTLKNLPLYWDEIKDEDAQRKVFGGVFSNSEGVTGNKMFSDRTLRPRYEWQTILIMCSNYSFADFLIDKMHTSAAALYRVFEFIVAKPEVTAPGQIASYDAARVLQQLTTNYGMAGQKYAKYLSVNTGTIDTFVRDTIHEFAQLVHQDTVERFWVTLCGVVLAGAKLANDVLNVGFDINGMRDFLVKSYAENRSRAQKEGSDNDSITNIEEALTMFLKHYIAHTVFTQTMPAPKGKPSPVTILYGPPQQNPRPIHVHWAVTDRLLRISRKEFAAYLSWKKVPVSQTMNGLEKHFKSTARYVTLAAGTTFRKGQEWTLEFPVPSGSPLEPLMNAFGGLEENPPLPPTPDPLPPGNSPLDQAMLQAAADLNTVRAA